MSENTLSFDAMRFIRDHNIDYVTEHPHCTSNRVNIHCPFCVGSRDYHLGVHLTQGYSNCWRCGGHSVLEVINATLAVSWKETYEIAERYENVSRVTLAKKQKTYNEKLVVPPGLRDLTAPHKLYLKQRKYAPDEIIKLWDIQSTGMIGDHKHRIYIPIHYLGQPVSYQCRSIKKHETLRYITCPEKHERVHHKHILYGLDAITGDTIVVVEGITDVWRLGPGAVATFGISYTKEQMFMLSRFKNVFIMFDKEVTAQKRARKLAAEIAYLNKKGRVTVVQHKTFDCDPGDLPQEEARKLMTEITKRTSRIRR